MNKKSLFDYKEKIFNLSKEEHILREKYLRNLIGPQTGYPSIDKPQLSVYNEEKYFKKHEGKNITQVLFENNADNLNTVATRYFFTNIKYKKFFENIKNLVKAFDKNGIKKGSHVSVCLPGMPESMTTLYALGYMGAVGIFMAPYQDVDAMISDIKKDNSKILVIMDKFYESGKAKFDRVIEEAGIEKVVIVPTLNSSVLRVIEKKKKYNNPKITMYNDFVKEGKDNELPEMAKYEKDMPVAVVYSSGTTGVLKGIVLSHDSINNIAISYESFGFDLSRGQRLYQAIPAWSSTGLVAVGTIVFNYGATLDENPIFEPLVFSKNLGLNKDNWGIGTTELFQGLSQVKENKLYRFLNKIGIISYKKMHTVLIGGTFSTPNDKQKINEALEALGCPAKAKAAYGTCENGSTVTAELNGYDYPDYSIGHPIPGVSVMAIDENCNELQYGQRGELAVKTNCGMIDYYNRPDLNIFFKDAGSFDTYKHTGDIGYVLPDGVVIYEGRKNDVSVVNGETLYNFDVKKAILDDKDVFDCEVFLNPKGNFCANIVLKDNTIDYNAKIDQLQDDIYHRFNNKNYVPIDYIFLESFPMATSTKRDYKLIKSQSTGYITREYKEPSKKLVLK